MPTFIYPDIYEQKSIRYIDVLEHVSFLLEELLDLLDRSWQGAEQLAPRGGYNDVVLESHSTDLHVFLDFGGVEVGGFLGVGQSFLYHEIDEVDSGFNGNADSLLKHSSCP